MSTATDVKRAARLLVEARDRSAGIVDAGVAAMRREGRTIDTRVSYAEGSFGAYSIACSILAGAMGVPSIDDLTGETWDREDRSDKRLERPQLPGELIDPTADHVLFGRRTGTAMPERPVSDD